MFFLWSILVERVSLIREGIFANATLCFVGEVLFLNLIVMILLIIVYSRFFSTGGNKIVKPLIFVSFFTLLYLLINEISLIFTMDYSLSLIGDNIKDPVTDSFTDSANIVDSENSYEKAKDGKIDRDGTSTKHTYCKAILYAFCITLSVGLVCGIVAICVTEDVY